MTKTQILTHQQKEQINPNSVLQRDLIEILNHLLVFLMSRQYVNHPKRQNILKTHKA